MEPRLLLLALLPGVPGLRLPAGRFPDFHLEGSTNIDLRDFSLVINSDVCDEAVVELVTVVSSATRHQVRVVVARVQEERGIIRGSWGRPDMPGVVTRCRGGAGLPLVPSLSVSPSGWCSCWAGRPLARSRPRWAGAGAFRPCICCSFCVKPRLLLL